MQFRNTDSKSTVSISAMAPWDMWAMPSSLGIDEETLAAVRSGTASPDQTARAEACFNAAFAALRDAEINVSFPGKPS